MVMKGLSLIRLKCMIFFTPLCFYLAQTHLLSYVLFIFPWPQMHPEQGLFLTQASRLLINPAAVFLVSYFLGKRINLKAELSLVLNTLLQGSLVGSIFSFGLFLTQVKPSDIYNLYLYSYQFSLFIFLGLQIFFVSFAAIAIAFLRRKP